jgi:hypothetical protein
MDNEIVDLFCNFLEIFPNLKAEAFNLVAVIYGFRAAYIYKYNNYKKELSNTKVTKNDKSSLHRLCSICLENLDDNVETYTTECLHLFH